MVCEGPPRPLHQRRLRGILLMSRPPLLARRGMRGSALLRCCWDRSRRLKYLGYEERHHAVQTHVGDIDFLVLGVERDGKWFLQPRLLPGNRPLRRDVSIIVKTPHSDEYARWLHGSLNTRHRDHQ